MAASPRVRKLKWLCRRGMKELDVLLERFMLDQSDQLEHGEWPEFESLLALEDDQLWDMVQKPQASSLKQYHPILDRINHGPAITD